MTPRAWACCALLAAACSSSEPGLTREQAGQRVLDELEIDQPHIIVFSYPDQLDPGAELAAYQLRSSSAPAAPSVDVVAPSWFFWIDDDPGARFVHANRFVLVDAATGALAVTAAETWPVVDGDAPWTGAAEYWNPDAWIYGDAEQTPRRAQWGAVPDAAQECRLPGRAIVINAWQPDESGEDDFRWDGINMTDVLRDLVGLPTTYFGPKGYDETDREATPGAVTAWLASAAMQMQPGETLVLYLGGHGASFSDGEHALIGDFVSIEIAESLKKFHPEVNIVAVFDACQSGGMLPSLSSVADLAISAADAQQSSYGDIDGSGTCVDANAADKGGEFTNALVVTLTDLLSMPSQYAALEAAAEKNGSSFVEEALFAAFPGTADLNLAHAKRWGVAQIQIGAPEDVRPATPDPSGPTCDDDPAPAASCGAMVSEALENIVVDLVDLPPEETGSACDGATMLPEANATGHSDGVMSSAAEGDVDYTWQGSFEGCYTEPGIGGCGQRRGAPDLADPGAPLLGIESLPCGETPERTVVCGPGIAGLAGAFEVVYVALADPPASDRLLTYQYGFVFDSDGDAANDYVPDPAFPADFFAGTDRWYVASHSDATGWVLTVQHVVDGTPVGQENSGARLVIEGEVMVLVVPAAELPGATPRVRTTAFRHTGDFGASSPWSGDVVPEVGAPLRPL